MPALAMNHFTLLTKDVAATEEFYGDLLGLKSGYRPPISRPGVWLYAGDYPILHVIDPANMPSEARGVLDHMAFTGSGHRKTLWETQTAWREIRTPRQQGETGAWQLFFTIRMAPRSNSISPRASRKLNRYLNLDCLRHDPEKWEPDFG